MYNKNIRTSGTCMRCEVIDGECFKFLNSADSNKYYQVPFGEFNSDVRLPYGWYMTFLSSPKDTCIVELVPHFNYQNDVSYMKNTECVDADDLEDYYVEWNSIPRNPHYAIIFDFGEKYYAFENESKWKACVSYLSEEYDSSAIFAFHVDRVAKTRVIVE